MRRNKDGTAITKIRTCQLKASKNAGHTAFCEYLCSAGVSKQTNHVKINIKATSSDITCDSSHPQMNV
jgi:hypothetical protein